MHFWLKLPAMEAAFYLLLVVGHLGSFDGRSSGVGGQRPNNIGDAAQLFGSP